MPASWRCGKQHTHVEAHLNIIFLKVGIRDKEFPAWRCHQHLVSRNVGRRASIWQYALLQQQCSGESNNEHPWQYSRKRHAAALPRATAKQGRRFAQVLNPGRRRTSRGQRHSTSNGQFITARQSRAAVAEDQLVQGHVRREHDRPATVAIGERAFACSCESANPRVTRRSQSTSALYLSLIHI